MPILSFLLLFSFAGLACEFKANTTVYSLSGPVTVTLKKLGLLHPKNVKGISVFHPVSAEEFKGEFLPGGVFLSHAALSSMGGSIVLFDEGQELARIFKRADNVSSIEIKTRGLIPSEVEKLVAEKISPYLRGCEGEIVRLEKELKQSQEKLLKLLPKKSMVFFMGEVKERLPDLLMVNDGVVKWLVSEKKISTYPSDLAYINWSAKIMQSMPKDTLKIGLRDSGNKMVKDVKQNGVGINLTYPGVLIPGRGQVEGLIYLFGSGLSF